MRLGQLARKLALRPDEIVEFLSAKKIQIEDNSNTKLENEHVTLIIKKFAPSMLDEVTKEVQAENRQASIPTPIANVFAPQTEEEPTEVKPETVEVKEEETPVHSAAEDLQSIIEKTDIIKAPKVELSGLKVVGKIELPEPKKKIIETPLEVGKSAPSGETQDNRKTRSPYKDSSPARSKRFDQRERPNPIAAQREREALEIERKRLADAEREKEKRTQHYIKKVKISPPTKSVKLIDEPLEEFNAEPAAKPKGVFGRFFAWLKS